MVYSCNFSTLREAEAGESNTWAPSWQCSHLARPCCKIKKLRKGLGMELSMKALGSEHGKERGEKGKDQSYWKLISTSAISSDHNHYQQMTWTAGVHSPKVPAAPLTHSARLTSSEVTLDCMLSLCSETKIKQNMLSLEYNPQPVRCSHGCCSNTAEQDLQ